MAHATKRGRNWRCLVFSHYEYKDGKKVRRYKSFTAPTRREAERLAAQYEYDRAHTPQTITVHDAIEQYISVKESALSPSTVTGYRSYFRTNKYELIEDMGVSTVDQRTLQLWVASMLDEEYAPKYIHNLYGLLRPALTMAGVGSIPITLPMVIMPDIYVPTDKELKTLLAYLDKNDRETKTAAMLAAFGSMRRSEICALKPSDFSGNTVTVNGVGEQLLAGAGLAGDQHRDVGVGDPIDEVEDLLHRHIVRQNKAEICVLHYCFRVKLHSSACHLLFSSLILRISLME